MVLLYFTSLPTSVFTISAEKTSKRKQSCYQLPLLFVIQTIQNAITRFQNNFTIECKKMNMGMHKICYWYKMDGGEGVIRPVAPQLHPCNFVQVCLRSVLSGGKKRRMVNIFLSLFLK